MNDNTLHGRLTASGNLTGTVNTIVYAHNYNDLSNKPSINSVTLQGNKTASDLGLVTPSDIPVTSVNEQTGDVELTGDNIPYDTLTSVNAKINDLESQIVGAGVQSVNGMTGNVTLTGANINYSVGVSLNSRIDAVEGEIPVINYPVTSVNGKTGAVSLAGSDIEYSEGVSLNDQIDNVSGEISDLTGADIPMTALDSTKVATAIGDLSSLTTTNKDSLVDAVNEVNGNLPRVVYSEKNWANSHSFDTPNDTAFMLYTDSDTSVAKVRIFNNNSASLYNISGSSITGVTYTNGTLTVSVNNRGLVAVQII